MKKSLISRQAEEKKSQRQPPMGRNVCLRLHAALLRADAAGKSRRAAMQAGADGVSVAAAIQLREHDILIPPAGGPFLDWKAIRRNGRGSTNAGPQTLHTTANTRWQIAMAMHMGVTFQQKRRAGAVLTILQEQNLTGVDRRAVLDLMELSYQRRHPVVFVAKQSWDAPARGNNLAAAKLPRIVVDGNDPIAVYRVCQESLRRAREGTGSTLVECLLEAGHNDLEFMESLLEKYGLWFPDMK